MRIYVVALAITLTLTSCMSPQEQLDLDRRTCLPYGYRDSSQKLAECIKDLQMQRKNFDNEIFIGKSKGLDKRS